MPLWFLRKKDVVMLQAIAKVFEFSEASVSPKKLRQITLLMILALPTWPLLMANHYGYLPENVWGKLAFAAIVIGAISMVCFVCTRFVNRFYFPDKYLDEWEITIKHKSMSFSFMVLVWIVSPAVLILMAFNDFRVSLTGEELGLWIVGILLIMLNLQTFHALWQVKPIDEDELGEPVKKSKVGLIVLVIAIFVLFIIPFSFGLVSGFNSVRG
ncbi:MAG: hypothetical protein ABJN22_07230 [Litorimonas sp.]